MHAKRMKIDLCTIEMQNYKAKERIDFYRKLVEKVDDDAKRKERLEHQECILCFETSRIGGSCATDRQCAHCDAVVHYSNTNVDVLCVDCAKKAKLCKHCGADIDFVNRRKRTLPG